MFNIVALASQLVSLIFYDSFVKVSAHVIYYLFKSDSNKKGRQSVKWLRFGSGSISLVSFLSFATIRFLLWFIFFRQRIILHVIAFIETLKIIVKSEIENNNQIWKLVIKLFFILSFELQTEKLENEF